MSHRPDLTPALFLALALLAGQGCAAKGTYVWANALPTNDLTVKRTGAYVIEGGDLVDVRVLGQDSVSTRSRVRPDGRISVPLVGEIMARGQTPAGLAFDLEVRLKKYLLTPSVSVIVEEVHPTQISVVGEVTHPGVFSVDPDSGVLQAIATAGGPTEYAARDRIFVVRSNQGIPMRIRFTYDRLTRGEPPDAIFALRAGDTVVVE